MKILFSVFLLLISFLSGTTQPTYSSSYWHNLPRTVRYHPDGTDFVITNGNRRFTRALYGTNTAFRVEAGDLPEFAMYLPGMGGNLKFGIINGDSSRWLIDAKKITARYRPGSMLYDITDPLLGKGILHLHLLAMGDAEGLVLKVTAENIPSTAQIIWVFGGVSGKKFSRDGDLNVDPESSFYLKPEYCTTNHISPNKNGFTLNYSTKSSLQEADRYQGFALAGDSAEALKQNAQMIEGIFPTTGLHLADANAQSTPANLYQSGSSTTPVITGRLSFPGAKPVYLALKKPDGRQLTFDSLASVFAAAETARQLLANRIVIKTPDPYINTLGGVIGIAADAIWESPTYLHGAIGWRIRLDGWRGPYAGDVLGWHDRARTHFRSYAQSQLTMPPGLVAMDTALHLSRSLEKLGTSVYSSGYISRNPGGDRLQAHHYDMNLVYVDQLLRHFNWTGDTAFVQEMWPVIERHLAWEKRNFDPDDDGLYDAYAAIWASDALEYSGGAVTHTSAYNYYANKQAAMLAKVIGKNGQPYEQEAAKIKDALNKKLWMPKTGSYAEYQDALGEKRLHPSAGLWTFYHTLDSEVPDTFQAYQMMQFIDHNTPHIPIRAKGLADSFYTLSTTNWMPYDWSLNNVATAEVMHTALANWQAGRNNEAFQLWKSELLSTMYLGASAGNIGQISFYDAARGEAYRDFGDPVGMTSRSLIEGLFGILPDALHNKLTIRPGFPASWKSASIKTPDIAYDFQSVGNTDTYIITPSFQKQLALQLQIKVRKDKILSVLVNGKKAVWKAIDETIGQPEMEIEAPAAKTYVVKISWGGNNLEKLPKQNVFPTGSPYQWRLKLASVEDVKDPQHLFRKIVSVNRFLLATLGNDTGAKTTFLQMKQGGFSWWQPVSISLQSPLKIKTDFADWRKKLPANTAYEKLNLTSYFNDKVTQIFKNQYLSPRPTGPTLQLPTQGIGDWTHPLKTAEINDRGLRALAGTKNEILLPQGIPFTTPSDTVKQNIIFTSQWDNYPKTVSISLSGQASHAYFLMAGSTNPMQSRMVNGTLIVRYTDGSADSLELKNPETWWPIEQDYMNDGYAFRLNAPRPVRVHLKTGKVVSDYDGSIAAYAGMMIDGGGATVLDLPLNPLKKLQSLQLATHANDVVIGLMAVTLVRK